jgi:hypothetical protein
MSRDILCLEIDVQMHLHLPSMTKTHWRRDSFQTMNLIESLPVSMISHHWLPNICIFFLVPDYLLRPFSHNTVAELLCLHRGQGLEIFWRDSLQCPTEEEYVGMVNDSWVLFCTVFRVLQTRDRRPLVQFSVIYARPETGGLFRIAVKLMMACSTANSDMCAVSPVCLFVLIYTFLSLQRLRAPCQHIWHIFSNQGWLYESAKYTGALH